MKSQDMDEPKVIKSMICLTPDLSRRLDAVAARQVTSPSLLIRQACELYLRQVEQQASTMTEGAA